MDYEEIMTKITEYFSSMLIILDICEVRKAGCRRVAFPQYIWHSSVIVLMHINIFTDECKIFGETCTHVIFRADMPMNFVALLNPFLAIYEILWIDKTWIPSSNIPSNGTRFN